MKLDKKYFPHFMAVMAVLSAMIIVYSSFKFEDTRRERYLNSISENDSLSTKSLTLILDEGTTSVAAYEGDFVVLVFWASWSDRSYEMLNELYALLDQRQDLTVMAALVKDATETIDLELLIPELVYVDGAELYNELKVPGIPSYILFDKQGVYSYAHIGYQEGAGYSLLKEWIDE